MLLFGVLSTGWLFICWKDDARDSAFEVRGGVAITINPSVAKAGGSHSQGAKGEVVAIYYDPLATPDLASSGFPGRVKK